VKSLAASVLFFLACATAHGQVATETPAPRPADRIGDKVDPDAYAILSSARGLNTHRPMYLFPATYSSKFRGEQTELVGQLSGKWRVFGTDLFLAYTQKSFWQYVNGDESSPFRETSYNPEVFYRWELDRKRFNRWALDIGAEHESNGQRFSDPDNRSRSWNRIYVAPFQAKGRHLAYLKFWYRIPEGSASSPTNPNGDDNPDITDFLGYGELTGIWKPGGHSVTALLRGNPSTGKGAGQLTWMSPPLWGPMKAYV